MSEPDDLDWLVSLWEAVDALSRVHRALVRRIQADNDCVPTGVDCNMRSGGKPCACILEAKHQIHEHP